MPMGGRAGPAQVNGVHAYPSGELQRLAGAADLDPPGLGSAGVDWAAVAELRAAVAGRLQAERGRPDRAGLSEQDERMLAAGLVGEEIERWALARAATGRPALGRAEERALAEAVTAALFGLGRLQPLLDRQDVENIHIHGHDRVVLELADGRLEPPVPGGVPERASGVGEQRREPLHPPVHRHVIDPDAAFSKLGLARSATPASPPACRSSSSSGADARRRPAVACSTAAHVTGCRGSAGRTSDDHRKGVWDLS